MRNLALATGIGSAALLAAFLYSRRSSTAEAEKVGAHRADGRDDSRSFAARIADEGTIPDGMAEPAWRLRAVPPGSG